MREIPRSRDQYYLRLPNQWGICSAQCGRNHLEEQLLNQWHAVLR